MQSRITPLLCVPIVLGLLTVTALAQPLVWDGGGDGTDWFDSLNWDPNASPADDANRIVLSGAPVASTTVSANYGGAISVTGAGWATFEDELYIGAYSTGIFAVADGGSVSSCWTSIGGYSGDGTATVDGAGSAWENTGALDVGEGGSGTLAITGGGSVSNLLNGYVGAESGSSGTATVDGAGSTWKNTQDLYVGDGGHGTLAITDGASVSNKRGFIGYADGSDGNATVDGAGSVWANTSDLHVGLEGHGTLAITGGGSVSNDWGCIGTLPGSDGTVTVEGAGSTWTTNYCPLYVGNEGSGTLAITGGGSVSNGPSAIGNWPGSDGNATVDGTGSTWTNSGDLVVGNGGTGTLAITDGGSVSNVLDGHVRGTATVDGAGSTWTNSQDLYVGYYQDYGRLAITGGGSVSNGSGFIGYADGSDGTVTVDGAGSMWTNSRDLFVGSAGTGTLAITGGGGVLNEHAHIGYAFGSHGTATVDGTGSSCHDIQWWMNKKSLGVGHGGRGELAITGCALVSSGEGCIGFASGSHGTVTVRDGGSNLLVFHGTTTSGFLYVGFEGRGELLILDGAYVYVENGLGYVGRNAGSQGDVLVFGSGSTWDNDGDLYVGGSETTAGGTGTVTIYGGELYVGGLLKVWDTGTVNLNAGGLVVAEEVDVSSSGPLEFNTQPGSTLRVNTLTGFGDAVSFNGSLQIGHASGGSHTVGAAQSLTVGEGLFLGLFADGTLTVENGGEVSAKTLYASLDRLLGDGTVVVKGAVLDADVIVDAAHGAQPTLTFGTGGELHVNLDGTGALGAGHKGAGTLTIADGLDAASTSGYVAYGMASKGSVMVGGSGSTWTNSQNLYVGHGTVSEGTLAITGGASVWDVSGYVAYGRSSTGYVTVDGDGSMWMNSGNLYVGGSETAAGLIATVTVSNGGLLDVDGLLKVWDASGASTLMLTGGQVTCGSFDNSAGGTFDFTGGALTVGGGAFDPGTVDFMLAGPDDPNLTLTGSATTAAIVGKMTVGYENDNGPYGTLNVLDGAYLTAARAVLGDFGATEGTTRVSGPESRWDVSGDLCVGRYGHGELVISAGGAVSCSYGSIGADSPGSGSIMVEGDGSRFVTTADNFNFYVGGSGNANAPGELTVRDGARVEVAGTLRTWLYGTISLEGGQVTCGSFDNSAGGTFDFTGGELHVETFIGDLIDDGGTICPGQSPGLMTVDGNLVLNAGTVEIELAGDGSNPAWCDRIDITGDVTLGGVLELDWLPVGGDPTSKFGGFYDILTYRGGLAGGFTGFGGNIGEAYIMGIVYDADLGDGLLAVRVELADLLAADTDLDGYVGYTDYAAVRDGFGSTEQDWFSGDLDFDGEVSYLDYVILKRSFGDAVAGAGGAGLPEPTTLALLALGGLAAMLKRRRT